MNKKQYVFHLIIFALGACLLGFGVALYCTANLGVDPMSTFALGLGNYLPLQVDEGIIAISYGMIVATYFIKRSHLGLGSFLYPFICGFATNIGFLILPICEHIILRYVMLCGGILCMGISIAITAKSRVGYTPYEGLAFALMHRYKQSYCSVRLLIDGSFLCIGLLLGAILGVGTIIVLLIMGPCASACMKCLEKTMEKLKERII